MKREYRFILGESFFVSIAVAFFEILALAYGPGPYGLGPLIILKSILS